MKKDTYTALTNYQKSAAHGGAAKTAGLPVALLHPINHPIFVIIFHTIYLYYTVSYLFKAAPQAFKVRAIRLSAAPLLS